MKRRDFIKSTAAITIGAAVSPNTIIAAQDSPTQKALIIDAMGEIRITHTRELIKEVIDSGTNSVTVTLCDPKHQEQEAFDVAMEWLLKYDQHIAANSDLFVKATKVGDINSAKKSGRLALFYLYQNTTQFGRDLDKIDLFYKLGLRSCQLTYNYQNWVGSGCKERGNNGLTKFGVEVIEKMNDICMLIDLSHANPKTMKDAIEISKVPVHISHTACMSVHKNIRNTTDDCLRKLADRDGMVGICQIRPFITNKKRDNLEFYFNHLDHAINTVGVEHVCIGSDRDHRVIADSPEELAQLHKEEGANFVDDDWPLFMTKLNGPRRMEVIWDGLKKRGYPEADVEKIMGLNLYQLYESVIG